ncbi:hypothetical protein [Undibacterium sp. TJN19]|uniref:hypothetical protein n=1 Tax=Undibacterium sp. TJN19 TaxID=3413055 RepID=UPI003BF2FBCF
MHVPGKKTASLSGDVVQVLTIYPDVYGEIGIEKQAEIFGSFFCLSIKYIHDILKNNTDCFSKNAETIFCKSACFYLCSKHNVGTLQAVIQHASDLLQATSYDDVERKTLVMPCFSRCPHRRPGA